MQNGNRRVIKEVTHFVHRH